MPRSHAEPLGEPFNAARLQSTLADQKHRPRYGVRSPRPRLRSRRALRPATEARAVARLSGRSGGGEVGAVFFFCRRRRANRPAVNAAALHADEKLAVESRIARKAGSRANAPGKCHKPII